MFKFIKKILGLATEEEKAAARAKPVAVAAKVEEKPQRAKNARGKFIADDPTTPENEAWVGGKAPAKKVKKAAAPKKKSKK